MINTNNSSAANERGRRHRRQKIRNLLHSRRSPLSKPNSNSVSITSAQATPNKSNSKRFGGHAKLVMFLVILITLLGFYYMGATYKSQMLTVFIAKYTSEYMSIMHNKIDYCDRDVDFSDLFSKLQQGVLHQEVALRKLEAAMQNRTNLRSIALVGSSGVGKSLTSRLLREHFPWQENVQFFPWNGDILSNTEKSHQVQNLLNYMSICGRNLLIIDNMAPHDHEFVTIINSAAINMLPKVAVTKPNYDNVDIEPTDKANQKLVEMYNNIDVTIIYIFNMNRLLTSDIYKKQYAQLQELPGTNVINYRGFGRDELAECIHHELKAEKMVMNDEDFQDILMSTAVAESGCKTVHAKVIVAGKHKKSLVSAAQNP